jgi:hypothetical protein
MKIRIIGCCRKDTDSQICELFINRIGGRRGCDHMVVGFTATYAISAYHH